MEEDDEEEEIPDDLAGTFYVQRTLLPTPFLFKIDDEKRFRAGKIDVSSKMSSILSCLIS